MDRYFEHMDKIREVKNSCRDLLQMATELEKIKYGTRNGYTDTTVYNDKYFDGRLHEYKTELKRLVKFLTLN